MTVLEARKILELLPENLELVVPYGAYYFKSNFQITVGKYSPYKDRSEGTFSRGGDINQINAAVIEL